MRIRVASVDDAPEMARINVEAGRPAWAHFLPVEELQPRDEWYAAKVESALAAFVTEADDGEIVGFVVALEDGLLDTLYAAPHVWGQGVGRALLDSALGALRDAGLQAAHLWTAEQNTRARRVSERYGFSLDGAATEKTFVGVTFTELRYTIDL